MTTTTLSQAQDYTLIERRVPGGDYNGGIAYDLIEANHHSGAHIAIAFEVETHTGWLLSADASTSELVGVRAPEVALVRTREHARTWLEMLAALYSAALGRTVNSELIVPPKPVPDARVAIRRCGRGWQCTCECGADGRPRISKARARQDARDHAARTGHENLAAVR